LKVIPIQKFTATWLYQSNTACLNLVGKFMQITELNFWSQIKRPN